MQAITGSKNKRMQRNRHHPAGGGTSGKSCEFCDELRDPARSRFGSIYGSAVSRIVIRKRGFVAQPTLGQIFEGSMLILPESHVETMAQLTPSQRNACLTLLGEVERNISDSGPVIVFEHGAKSAGGGGCGIYHAHFHLMPVPLECPISMADVRPADASMTVASSLDEALNQLHDTDEYLLFREPSGRVGFFEVRPSMRQIIPSQFFRRALVNHYGLSTPWDWRHYDFELKVISTIQRFSPCAV